MTDEQINRLLALADHIENRTDFDQDIPMKCTVTLGLEFANLTAHHGDSFEVFGQHYGLSEWQVRSLYWSRYGALFADEVNMSTLDVDRFKAAHILRRLATE